MRWFLGEKNKVESSVFETKIGSVTLESVNYCYTATLEWTRTVF